MEFIGLRKNKEEFPVEISFSSFKRNGNWHTVSILRDITERKLFENELLDTQHALRDAFKELTENQAKLVEMEKLITVQELSGAISHDFAQPLQVLSTYIGLIGTNGNKDEYIKTCNRMIRQIAGF